MRKSCSCLLISWRCLPMPFALNAMTWRGLNLTLALWSRASYSLQASQARANPARRRYSSR
jgi:hypothetical protein